MREIRNRLFFPILIVSILSGVGFFIDFQTLKGTVGATVFRVDHLMQRIDDIHTNICELSLSLLDEKDTNLRHCRE